MRKYSCDRCTVYGSLDEFRGWFAGVNENYASPDWAGGTTADALKYAEFGDVSAVPKAEKILAKLDTEIDSDGCRPQWQPSMVGAYPSVPAYIAGMPESMMCRTELPDERGDVEIWISTTVSAKTKATAMKRRGVVALAMALALSRVRNVRLVVFGEAAGNAPVIRLQSPINVAEVCAVLTQSCITRQLIYEHSYKGIPATYDGCWAGWSEPKAGRDNAIAFLRESAGMPEDAVYMGTGTMEDYGKFGDDQLVNMLNKQIRSFADRG